jgi:hypothetical protein
MKKPSSIRSRVVPFLEGLVNSCSGHTTCTCARATTLGSLAQLASGASKRSSSTSLNDIKIEGQPLGNKSSNAWVFAGQHITPLLTNNVAVKFIVNYHNHSNGSLTEKLSVLHTLFLVTLILLRKW